MALRKSYICERCGKELTVVEKEEWTNEFRENKSRFYFFFKDDTDLCPKCNASYLKWLDGHYEEKTPDR